MPTNWIKHAVSQTPTIITGDDLVQVDEGKLSEYYQSVKLLSLLRSSVLPDTLKNRLQNSGPPKYCSILEEAISSGNFMDTGWTDEYYHAAEEVSFRMRGYPKASRAQWRSLQDAIREQEYKEWNEEPIQESAKSKPSPPPAPARSRYFLDLPSEIRDQIYRHLLVRENISIGDWQVEWLESQPKNRWLRRTEYDVFDAKTRHKRRTTYTVRSLGRQLFIYTNIMRVNRQVHAEAAKIFYSENKFNFLGTGDSALAFLHDRASKLDTISKISVRFMTDPTMRFKGCYNWTCKIFAPPRTFIGAWRRICNVFVHSSVGLQDFELILDASFWLETDWREQGAEAVFATPRLCQPESAPWREHDRNFLQHAARLGGVNLRLTIEGIEGDREKDAFRRALERRMQEETFGRPWLAEDSKPVCTCAKRLLSESCIWDREGKMRRMNGAY